MTNPCIVAVYTGAILMGSGISLPTFLEDTISGISSCNTPLSMMLVGMMLAEMNPKGLLTKSVAFYTFVPVSYTHLIGVLHVCPWSS